MKKVPPKTHVPFEYSQIDEKVFIGTNACCQMHFKKALLDKGLSADISLEGELVDQPLGIQTYVWLPTADHTPPSPENARAGIAVLKQMLADGRKVYIHCKNGHGRAPTFYAAYLIREKAMTPDEALKTIIAKRPSAHLNEAQMTYLRDFAAGR